MRRVLWLVSTLTLMLAASSAHAALDWHSLWSTADQRAEQSMRKGDAHTAARTFVDPRHKAFAELQAGDYASAAHGFAAFDDSNAHYNRGNALAHAGDLAAALKAYDAALAREPNNQDARHNRDLVERALRSQSPPPPQDQSKDSKQGKGDSKNESKNDEKKDAKQDAKQDAKSGSKTKPQQGDKNASAAGNSKAQSGANTPSKDAGKQGATQDAQQQGKQGEPPPSGEHGNSAQKSGDGTKNAAQSPGQAASKAADDKQQAARDAAAALASTPTPKPGSPSADKPGAAANDQTGDAAKPGAAQAQADGMTTAQRERQLSQEQWLERIPDDPGGLLRRKLLIEHLMRQQQGQP